jgi:hypothetical protein
MDSFFIYLIQLNITLVVLFVAYKIFFERDKNFVVRRIYLLGTLTLPFLLPLMPEKTQMSVGTLASVSIHLEGVTVLGNGDAQHVSGIPDTGMILMLLYFLVLAAGITKLCLQLFGILRAIQSAERVVVDGTTVLHNSSFHASSFFGYIFINSASAKGDSFSHILQHESIHKKEWHSVDRVLVELFVMINWFNPVAWLIRKSMIENLEFLADSAVLRRGTDPAGYQLSILNQYIGSASISNQFSSQIKNRINMLNKDYKLGSSWKLILLFPLVFIAFLLVSCAEKDATSKNPEAIQDQDKEVQMTAGQASVAHQPSLEGEELFYVVEEMPTFQGTDPVESFRKYIAQNLTYPKEAVENGITGKVFISFVVTKSGEVVIPEPGVLAELEGKDLDEVVVVAYRTLEKDQEEPDQKYIDMLKSEVVRVISGSPQWEPGKQRGQAVNVIFTFPVTFTLQ